MKTQETLRAALAILKDCTVDADDALPAEMAKVLLDEIENSSGYKSAFYKIADALDIPAMPLSPKEVFETVIMPKLNMLMAVRQAVGFKAGDTVLLEMSREISHDELTSIAVAVKLATDSTGVKFVIIPSQIRIVDRRN